MSAMRVFYLDPGLHSDVGHHANYCRYIVGELRGRNIETHVFAHRDISSSLRREFQAAPHFHVDTYAPYGPWLGWRGWLTDFWSYRWDLVGEFHHHGLGAFLPRSNRASRSPRVTLARLPNHATYMPDADSVWRHWRGCFTGFARITRITSGDLSQLPTPETTDIVFAVSVLPAQLSALIRWRQRLQEGGRPTIVAEVARTGLAVRQGAGGDEIFIPDPRVDPTAALFRHAARRLPRENAPGFHLVTFAEGAAELLGLLTQYRTETLPLPYRQVSSLRNRAGTEPVRVSLLGHHKTEKGSDQLPAIIDELLRSFTGIHLLVQAVDSQISPESLQALRKIAARDERIIFDGRPAGGTRWAQLLEMSDIVVCAYRPGYHLAFSAVLAEALANGIAVVVPARTPLEVFMMESGGAGATFDQFTPTSIAAATGRVLNHFDHFATLAHSAALRWHEKRGPARMVDRLISLPKISNH